MGAQNSLERAEEFRTSTGTESFLMIWDESFASWEYYGIRGQPAAVLVDSNGEPITGWTGAFDEEEVLRLAADL